MICGCRLFGCYLDNFSISFGCLLGILVVPGDETATISNTAAHSLYHGNLSLSSLHSHNHMTYNPNNVNLSERVCNDIPQMFTQQSYVSKLYR